MITNDPIEQMAKQLTIALNVKVDDSIVKEIVELFDKGILELVVLEPQLNYTDNSKVTGMLAVGVRYLGDEKIRGLEIEIEKLKEENERLKYKAEAPRKCLNCGNRSMWSCDIDYESEIQKRDKLLEKALRVCKTCVPNKTWTVNYAKELIKEIEEVEALGIK